MSGLGFLFALDGCISVADDEGDGGQVVREVGECGPVGDELFMRDEAAEDHPKLAPFTSFDWDTSGAVVTVSSLGEDRYHLKGINGVEFADITVFAQTQYCDKWKKRLEEDLVEVLLTMGQPVGPNVSLVLESGAGDLMCLPSVGMTEENRARIVEENSVEPPKPPSKISKDQALQDLQWLSDVIDTRFSYRGLTPYDYTQAILDYGESLRDWVDTKVFSRGVAKLVAPLGDGHSRVRPRGYPEGYFDVLFFDVGGRVLAVEPDRSGFIREGYPFVTEIARLEIDVWLEQASKYVPRGSEQYQRNHQLRMLRYAQLLGSEQNWNPRPAVRFDFSDGKGKTEFGYERLGESRGLYGDWPRTESKVLDGNLGYLRIHYMDGEPKFLGRLAQMMWSFSDTDGLIIDVRGNGGGTRDVLTTLAPYFLDDKQPAILANVVRPRLDPEIQNGNSCLEDRGLLPRENDVWSETARDLVSPVIDSFSPEWVPEYDNLGEPLYLVLEAGDEHYDKPVIVLMDSNFFSATDIFLAAFGEMDTVTLMGQPSGGGSEVSQEFVLPHSRIEVRFSTMVSYQSNGQLFDGVGVQPDVLFEPEPGYYIGESDLMLDEAVKMLQQASLP